MSSPSAVALLAFGLFFLHAAFRELWGDDDDDGTD